VSDVLFSILSFIVAVGVLITVHEFGHFWVARTLGVKVLQFSIGFGRALWRRRAGLDQTEYVLAALPLGGYVRMLDEREGEVQAHERPRAFNRQPVWSRIAIVVAGPAFNFLFAIAAFWLMVIVGVTGPRPIVGEVVPGSYAEAAGLKSGDEIVAVEGERTPIWDAAAMALLAAAVEGRLVDVQVRGGDLTPQHRALDLRDASDLTGDGGFLENLGIRPWRPVVPAVIGTVVPGEAAERAGLLPGDKILSADAKTIDGWLAWVEYVRARPEQAIELTVERAGRLTALTLRPDRVDTRYGAIGRIGAHVEQPEESTQEGEGELRYGPLEGIPAAVAKTWEISVLTVRMLWKMVIGQASVENISGPISIAQYAGMSASIGFTSFLKFLAIVSISLGILNLLPVPVLDGGHLMWYLVELIKGSPVSEHLQLVGQRVGIAALLALMILAFYNDLTRLFG
jgi:RIP metalloprotease RseP